LKHRLVVGKRNAASPGERIRNCLIHQYFPHYNERNEPKGREKRGRKRGGFVLLKERVTPSVKLPFSARGQGQKKRDRFLRRSLSAPREYQK